MSDHPLASGGLSVNAGPTARSYRRSILDRKCLDDRPERFDEAVVPSATPPAVLMDDVESQDVDAPGSGAERREAD